MDTDVQRLRRAYSAIVQRERQDNADRIADEVKITAEIEANANAISILSTNLTALEVKEASDKNILLGEIVALQTADSMVDAIVGEASISGSYSAGSLTLTPVFSKNVTIATNRLTHDKPLAESAIFLIHISCVITNASASNLHIKYGAGHVVQKTVYSGTPTSGQEIHFTCYLSSPPDGYFTLEWTGSGTLVVAAPPGSTSRFAISAIGYGTLASHTMLGDDVIFATKDDEKHTDVALCSAKGFVFMVNDLQFIRIRGSKLYIGERHIGEWIHYDDKEQTYHCVFNEDVHYDHHQSAIHFTPEKRILNVRNYRTMDSVMSEWQQIETRSIGSQGPARS